MISPHGSVTATQKQKPSPHGCSEGCFFFSVCLLLLQALAELDERLGADLADALAGEAEPPADLLERLRLVVIQAKAHAEDQGLALIHLVEQGLQMLQAV